MWCTVLLYNRLFTAGPMTLNHDMKSTVLSLLCFALAGCGLARGQEGMTPESFNKIIATPGDSTPLSRQLALVPFWRVPSVVII